MEKETCGVSSCEWRIELGTKGTATSLAKTLLSRCKRTDVAQSIPRQTSHLLIISFVLQRFFHKYFSEKAEKEAKQPNKKKKKPEDDEEDVDEYADKIIEAVHQ